MHHFVFTKTYLQQKHKKWTWGLGGSFVEEFHVDLCLRTFSCTICCLSFSCSLLWRFAFDPLSHFIDSPAAKMVVCDLEHNVKGSCLQLTKTCLIRFLCLMQVIFACLADVLRAWIFLWLQLWFANSFHSTWKQSNSAISNNRPLSDKFSALCKTRNDI